MLSNFSQQCKIIIYFAVRVMFLHSLGTEAEGLERREANQTCFFEKVWGLGKASGMRVPQPCLQSDAINNCDVIGCALSSSC